MNTLSEFLEILWNHYKEHGRDLPWRHEPYNAYHILVSEVMLQQTQVNRVVPKYTEFLIRFPTTQTLAKAPLSDVLRMWSGLGYNRRAQYLHLAAKQLSAQTEPWGIATLSACKGIGHNTAAAVATYAYNEPVVFIETNIRTVYIHHFFPDKDKVSDKELMPYIEATLDQEHPREFMWAVMDYGSFLKARVGNVARSSKHYSKQPRFEGSKRQIRGKVLRELMVSPQRAGNLQAAIADSRLNVVLYDLIQEGLVRQNGEYYELVN